METVILHPRACMALRVPPQLQGGLFLCKPAPPTHTPALALLRLRAVKHFPWSTETSTNRTKQYAKLHHLFCYFCQHMSNFLCFLISSLFLPSSTPFSFLRRILSPIFRWFSVQSHIIIEKWHKPWLNIYSENFKTFERDKINNPEENKC